MSNKKKLQKRQTRVPVKFSDHILGMNQTKHSSQKTESTDRKKKIVVEEKESPKNIEKEMDEKERLDEKEEMSGGELVNLEKGDVHEKIIGSVNMENGIGVEEKPVEVPETTGENTVDNQDKTNGGTYVEAVQKQVDMIECKLSYVPTSFTEAGQEVVIFDEELVELGSQKWRRTLSGYFVGFRMMGNELRYHLRRMWAKFGIKDIVDNGNGNWLFKFSNDEGLQKVLEQGPWMVKGKPLMVNKWSPEHGFEKLEHSKVPVWAQLHNLPVEAWSTKGISAIASGLGTPMVMDAMTTTVCNEGVGRTAYARVLVEVDAIKGYKEQIDIQYRNCDIRHFDPSDF